MNNPQRDNDEPHRCDVCARLIFKKGLCNLCVQPSIFAEAEQIVSGPRQDDYGEPKENFTRIAALWSALLSTPVTARQAALCMAALKLAREAHSHKRDNLVDAAGYLRIVELLEDQ